MGFDDLITKADLAAAMKVLMEQMKAIKAPKEDKYLNLEEAARYIKRKPSTLGDLVRNGEIAYIRDGRLLKFTIEDLDRYMMAHRVMSNAEIESAVSVRGI